MNLKDLSFTKDWTLFLDRDGVINRRIPGGYVTNWEEFHFLGGVLDSLRILSGIFGRIVIVSNQQGVGKGIMSLEDLYFIDNMMKDEIRKAGGRIDASYYSPHLDHEGHPDRKPGAGMGTRAKADFPEIDFARSVMVGDTGNDMIFGKNLGMITVLVNESANEKDQNADFCFKSLYEFAVVESRKLQTASHRPGAKN